METGPDIVETTKWKKIRMKSVGLWGLVDVR